ncbi:helix-turn-helix domain-containing protein [Pseudogracilibacillus auburnensis]|uniref:helix-turn-helix domain-containing protein n=1 Tax=Pseudogracilibacillus auburnensis TaxID=1494959 RepID=UPI001A979E96|nr:helix-turn-helix transcriptional regulator [Pseudogracilibacillus auburnensis]MBO1003160.1 helix-turn-helix transcriptional regulator [Pseudogracilibacillus auburnensis]
MYLKRLITLRKKHKLNQEDIAKFLGVARTTYAMYEQGNREMDYELLIKLADYYKVSLDYLFGRSDNPVHIESYAYDEIEFINRTLEVYRDLKSKK